MKTLRSIAFVSMLVLATPLLAQGGHQHHGGSAAEVPTPDVAEIAPAAPAKGGCDKCKKMGMGDKMSHGGGMGGGAADTALLERRIDELEKRLDLMQLLLQREAR
jgi:hypothetical protein